MAVLHSHPYSFPSRHQQPSSPLRSPPLWFFPRQLQLQPWRERHSLAELTSLLGACQQSPPTRTSISPSCCSPRSSLLVSSPARAGQPTPPALLLPWARAPPRLLWTLRRSFSWPAPSSSSNLPWARPLQACAQGPPMVVELLSMASLHSSASLNSFPNHGGRAGVPWPALVSGDVHFGAPPCSILFPLFSLLMAAGSHGAGPCSMPTPLFLFSLPRAPFLPAPRSSPYCAAAALSPYLASAHPWQPVWWPS